MYYAPTFTVFSDNNPLTYVLSTAKLNATTSRWVAELADFHFTIKYRPGRENSDADALSRMPLDIESVMYGCSEELSSDVIGATIQSIEVQKESNLAWSFALTAQPPSAESETIASPIAPIPIEHLREAQKTDLSIFPVLNCKLSGSKRKS